MYLFYFTCMSFCLHVYVRHVRPGAHGIQKRLQSPWKWAYEWLETALVVPATKLWAL